MPVLFTNNASTTLSAGINNSTTTIPIASAGGFPSLSSGQYYFGTISNTNNTKIEIVKVASGTTSLTVTRGQDGTSAQAFDSGDNFQLRVTAATLSAVSVTDVAVTGGTVSADTLIAKGDGASADGQIQLNCRDNSHGIKLKSPPHSASANYTLTFPNNDGDANQKLTTNGSGVLTWTDDAATDSTKMPLAGGAFSGAVTTNSTFDGRDVAADGVTADAALPKAGGAMTGAITTNSTFDGRDVATDGTKLDGIEANATADQTAAQIKTHLENGIDSVHYVDASIDLAHISSEAVDEDNLYISNAGTNGFFLQKQSGNNGGLTWAEVPEGEDYIPNGSVMVFFQASAPTGWTKVTTQNDKTLRVVSGNGGGTGGDWAMSAGETTSEHAGHVHTGAAHTHTSAAHTHTGAAHTHGGGNLAAAATTIAISTMPSHTHNRELSGSYYQGNGNGNRAIVTPHGNLANGSTGSTGGGGSHSHNMSGNTASTTPGNSGSTTPGATGSTTPGNSGSAGTHTHTIQAPQYIDVIICSKDA